MKNLMPILPVMLFLGACTQPQTVELESGAVLEAMTARWEAAFNKNDAVALGAFYAKDAILMPPNSPSQIGRDAIVKVHANEGLVRLELTDRESWVSGDVGYKRGDYLMKSGNATIDDGKYVEIWRKIDGQWLIHRDMYNSNLQPTTQ